MKAKEHGQWNNKEKQHSLKQGKQRNLLKWAFQCMNLKHVTFPWLSTSAQKSQAN